MEESKQVPILCVQNPKEPVYINHFYILPVDSEIIIDFNSVNYRETLKHVKDGQPSEIHINPITSIQMRKEVAMDLFRELAARLMPVQPPQTSEVSQNNTEESKK